MTRPLTIALANSGRKWIGEVAHVAMLYEQLEALGHRPWIVCRKGYALESYAQGRGWRVLSLHFHNRIHWRMDWADWRAWVRWVRAEKADLIHCHRGADHWLGCYTAKWTGLPLVRTRHVMTPVARHWGNRWLFLRATDAIICVSQAVREGFGEWKDRLPRGRVILSAVNSAQFNPSRRSERWRGWRPADDAGHGEGSGRPESADWLWFGLVGRMQNIKGHRYFLAAAAKVARKHPEARFFIAGRGSEGRRRRLMERAEALGIGDRLRIAGQVEALPEALASLDIGVIASVGSEGSSRIALEMMASGLPIVATRVGGIPELAASVESGEGGESHAPGARLVPPRNSNAMAEAMLAWAEDPEARSRAGADNRRKAQSNHDPKRWAEAIVGVYRETLAARGK